MSFPYFLTFLVFVLSLAKLPKQNMFNMVQFYMLLPTRNDANYREPEAKPLMMSPKHGSNTSSYYDEKKRFYLMVMVFLCKIASMN